MSILYSDIEAKALLLHYGVTFTDSALSEFQNESTLLSKRRVYSNYDEKSYLSIPVPPEVVFSSSKIVANVILKKESPLRIDYCDGHFFLQDKNNPTYQKRIDFFKSPLFYRKRTSSGDYTNRYITKLFGHSLGVFVSPSCFFSRHDTICKFCSIKSNQGRPSNACSISPSNLDKLLESIEIALSCDNSINCIYISGGVTSADFDSNFLYYCNIAIEIRKKVNMINPNVEVTLNSYPPYSLTLFDKLKDNNIAYMLSIEALSDNKRAFYCPGKSKIYGNYGLDRIIDKLLNVVGYGKVLAFVIEGIEEPEKIIQAAQSYGYMGVCIIAHILHVDPGTWVENNKMQVPSVDEIIKTASALSHVYHRYGIDSSRYYGGRSSLDTESSLSIF